MKGCRGEGSDRARDARMAAAASVGCSKVEEPMRSVGRGGDVRLDVGCATVRIAGQIGSGSPRQEPEGRMRCPMKFRAAGRDDSCAGEECMWSVRVGEMYGCAIVWGMLDMRFDGYKVRISDSNSKMWEWKRGLLKNR